MTRNIVKSLSINEISSTGSPVAKHAVVTIMKSAEHRAPTTEEILKISPAVRDRANAWALENIVKSQELNMTTRTTEDIVKAYMDRHDVDEMEAFKKVSSRPEFQAAYDAEDEKKQADQARKNQVSY